MYEAILSGFWKSLVFFDNSLESVTVMTRETPPPLGDKGKAVSGHTVFPLSTGGGGPVLLMSSHATNSSADVACITKNDCWEKLSNWATDCLQGRCECDYYYRHNAHAPDCTARHCLEGGCADRVSSTYLGMAVHAVDIILCIVVLFLACGLCLRLRNSCLQNR